MAKSSLCATPFLIAKLAVNSLKSVFLDLSEAVSLLLSRLILLLISLIEPAISTPFSAPSARLNSALPCKPFLSALTVLP